MTIVSFQTSDILGPHGYPSFHQYRAEPKSKAWEECLPGIPPINPVKALNANFKSKIFTNQTKANAYKVIMKLLWFGEKCTPLHKISHLQWCNACHPKCKCATCDKQSCKCICHIDPTAREFNTLHHILFCPFLHPFWNMIHLLALSLSIYFPPETHLLKWSIVSAHMDKFQNQPMIFGEDQAMETVLKAIEAYNSGDADLELSYYTDEYAEKNGSFLKQWHEKTSRLNMKPVSYTHLTLPTILLV